MLAVILLSKHRILSSKIVRSRASCDTRCMRQAIRTWFAVCSTAVRWQWSLTQAVRGKPIPTGLGTGHECEHMEPGCIFTAIRVSSIIGPLKSGMPHPAKLSNRLRTPGTNKRLDHSLS